MRATFREVPLDEVLRIEQETLQSTETDGAHWVEHYVTLKAVGGFDIEDAHLKRRGNTVEVCVVLAR